jgi:hypothetical protein
MRGPREQGREFIRAAPFKPSRDRHIKCIAVPCPTCGAAAGSRCVNTTTGDPTKSAHKYRRVMALRALREEGEA